MRPNQGDYTNRKKPRYPVCITQTVTVPVPKGDSITVNMFTTPVNFKFTPTNLGVQYDMAGATFGAPVPAPVNRTITQVAVSNAAVDIRVNVTSAMTQHFTLTSLSYVTSNNLPAPFVAPDMLENERLDIVITNLVNHAGLGASWATTAIIRLDGVLEALDPLSPEHEDNAMDGSDTVEYQGVTN
jgi:hypothetical protein